MIDWLEIRRGEAPLVLTLPHTGTDIPSELEKRLVSPWLARKDADWWIDQLYAFASDLDVTTIRTRMSRTVVDVNRDPSGASLYPGQAGTGLCPMETFDGESLYISGCAPDTAEIDGRRERWFEPYHAAVAAELERLRARHPAVVLYDAHSIRSRIPRLFDGELPNLNIGTNRGRACAPALTSAIATAAATAGGFSSVVDGRFTGGWTTRHHGRPDEGVHAVQMEIGCRSYVAEPAVVTEANWPTPFDATSAEPLRTVLNRVLRAALAFTSPTATTMTMKDER